MAILAKIGERLYEFETKEDLTLARALYVRGDCRSYSNLEDMMDEEGIDYLIDDLSGLMG